MANGNLTPDRLAELRRIASAATPGPWRISDDGPADRFVIASADREHIAETTQGGSFTNEDLANAHHIATFDPPTVLAMIEEIERLRRERQTGVILTADDCNILMHGLRDRGELEGNLIPEALERYQQLVDRIIDVGTGYGGGAEDA